MSWQAALLVVAAVLAWPARSSAAARLRPPTPAQPATAAGGSPVRPLVAALAFVAAVGAFAAGLGWMVIVPVAGVIAMLLRRRARPATYPELPLVCELMAAALAAGASPPAAVRAACAAAEPPLAARLDAVAARLAAGDAPERAWATWLADQHLAAVGRTWVRVGGTGAAAAGELARTAARLRSRRRAVVERRAARATVWIVLPLGLCFLPAFVLVGVVPIALGLLHHLR